MGSERGERDDQHIGLSQCVWEDAWNAEKAAEVMKRKKPNTVGLVGMGNMSAALSENLRKGMQGVNVINGPIWLMK